MITFFRYFPDETLQLRFRNAAAGYFNFLTLVFDPAASADTVTPCIESPDGAADSLYTADSVVPAYPFLKEIIDASGNVVGSEVMTAPAPTVAEIDAALSVAHGGANWGGAGTVAIPSMTISFSATMVDKRRLTIKQGDTPRLSFNLGSDYTGWLPRFAAKSCYAGSYVIEPKVAFWSNAATGEGYVDLSSADTAASGELISEIQISNGAGRLTPLEVAITILPQIITG